MLQKNILHSQILNMCHFNKIFNVTNIKASLLKYIETKNEQKMK